MITQITLATLSTATAQQVFELVRDHLLRRMKRSMRNDIGPRCAYRSHDGLSCAAGRLIGDDEYTTEMEDVTSPALVSRKSAPTAHRMLIASLQHIHDAFMPENWEHELRQLAYQKYLTRTITLATLPTATAQEVFEQAAKHLLKQPVSSQETTSA